MASLGPALQGNHPVLSGGTFAIITADQPRFLPQNREGHEGLAAELATSGLKHEPTESAGEGKHHGAFLVYNPTREQAMELGRKYGQESIIFSENGQHQLIYTNGPKAGKFHPAKGPHQFFKHPPVDQNGPLTKVPGLGSVRFVFDVNSLHDVPKKPVGGHEEPMSDAKKSEVTVSDLKKSLATALRNQIEVFSKTLEDLRARELNKSDKCPICGNDGMACPCILKKSDFSMGGGAAPTEVAAPHMFSQVGQCSGCGGPVTEADLSGAKSIGFCDNCFLNGHPVAKGETRDLAISKIHENMKRIAQQKAKLRPKDEHMDEAQRQKFAAQGHSATIKAEMCKTCGTEHEGKCEKMAYSEPLEKPPVSEAQRRAMGAAASGHSTLGIPKKVGKEFIDADKGGKLPATKKGEDFIDLKSEGDRPATTDSAAKGGPRIVGKGHANPNPVKKCKELPGKHDAGSGGEITKGKGVKKGEVPAAKPPTAAPISAKPPTSQSNPGKIKMGKAYEIVEEGGGKNHVNPDDYNELDKAGASFTQAPPPTTGSGRAQVMADKAAGVARPPLNIKPISIPGKAKPAAGAPGAAGKPAVPGAKPAAPAKPAQPIGFVGKIKSVFGKNEEQAFPIFQKNEKLLGTCPLCNREEHTGNCA